MNNDDKILIQPLSCLNRKLIGIQIPYNKIDWRNKIKTISGRYWHEEERIWSIPYSKEAFADLVALFGKENLEKVETGESMKVSPPQYPNRNLTLKEGYTKHEGKHSYRNLENNAAFDRLNAKQQLAITKLEELLIEERKTYHTRKGYRNILIPFFLHYKDILPSQITHEQIRAYIVTKIREDDIAKSTQNHYISAFKAFYGRLLNQYEKVENLYRPEKEQHLPKTLEPEEIQRLLKQVGNLKHRCMLMLMYGSGLRVGEVVRLTLQDIDFDYKTVFVDTGKHYKDRYTILSDKTATYIQQYLNMHLPKPQYWLFESSDGGHYSERSVQIIFADALYKAKINKRVSTHSLRHAFATQLLKSNVDLDFVRKVMGHASIKTTQIYLHVLKTDLTKTRSPIDDLDI